MSSPSAACGEDECRQLRTGRAAQIPARRRGRFEQEAGVAEQAASARAPAASLSVGDKSIFPQASMRSGHRIGHRPRPDRRAARGSRRHRRQSRLRVSAATGIAVPVNSKHSRSTGVASRCGIGQAVAAREPARQSTDRVASAKAHAVGSSRSVSHESLATTIRLHSLDSAPRRSRNAWCRWPR